MPNTTINYGLTKPLPSEYVSLDVINGNMDIIDTEIKKANENMVSEKQNIIPIKTPTDLPSAYPMGVSTFYDWSDIWKTSAGFVSAYTVRYSINTFRPHTSCTIQRLTIFRTGSPWTIMAIYERASYNNVDWGTWGAMATSADLQAPMTSLASTAINEGSSLIGVHDTGNYYTSGNVEGVLQEIGASFTSQKADYVNRVPYAVATGTTNTYAVSLIPAPTSYIEGMAISVKINQTNTGASTINVNGLGAKSIKKSNGNDVFGGNLKIGGIYTFRHDGVNFILQGEGGEYGNATASEVLSGYTIGTENGLVTGNIPRKSNVVISPSAVEQVIPKGFYDGTLSSGKVTPVMITPGEILWTIAETEQINYDTNMKQCKRIKIYDVGGIVRVKFDMRAAGSTTAYGQIFKNGIAVGILRSNNSETYTTFTEDIAFSAGDSIQLYIRSNFYGSYAYCRNFGLYIAFPIARPAIESN